MLSDLEIEAAYRKLFRYATEQRLLLDDRFSTADYNRLFPAHWGHARTVSDCEEMTLLLQQFWDTPEGSDR